MFALQYKVRKGLNNAISTWKPGFSKIYTVSNYRILASRSYTILVGMGDFIRQLLSIEATAKYIWINFVCDCAGFFAFVVAQIPGLSGQLYLIFCIRSLRPTRHS